MGLNMMRNICFKMLNHFVVPVGGGAIMTTFPIGSTYGYSC